MKKILIALLALAILCAAFISCDKEQGTGTESGTDTDPAKVTDTGSTPTTQEPNDSSTLEVGVDTDDKFGPIQK